MLHYYMGASQDRDEAKKKGKYIKEEILPFQHYLDTSIEALENKKVKAKWRKALLEYNATLKPKGYFYEYTPTSALEINNSLCEFFDSLLLLENLPNDRDYDEKFIITLKGGSKEKLAIKEGDILESSNALLNLCGNDEIKEEALIINKGFLRLDSIKPNDIEKISWNGEDIKFISLREWLGSGNVELDSQNIEIKEFDGKQIILESITQASPQIIKAIRKDGFLLPVKLSINTLQAAYKVVQQATSTTQIIYSKEKIKSHTKSCVEINGYNYYDFGSLSSKEGVKPIFEKRDSKQAFIQNFEDFGDKTLLYDKNGAEILLEKIKLEDSHHIQLLPLEEAEDEIESPLRYFLDSEIEVKAEVLEHKKKKGRTCKVKIINRDEFIIELRHKGRAIVPIEDSILETQPNPYPLKCQQNAINALTHRPIDSSHTLLKLFASRKNDKIDWDNTPKQEDIEQWYVLSDSKRQGADIQRRFVEKALATKDFALLEGPPGSGKTTTILELIAQLIKRDKKILLCGSTHVAIDNVLERLKSRNLIKELGIFPIRVGSEGALSEAVQEFRLGDFERNYEDSLLEKYEVYDDLDALDSENKEEGKNTQGKIGLKLFMQCANLVCGTTIGILQYPAFKIHNRDDKKNGNKIKTPIMPEFDYLIIDESSKTTFQEFLVPAMYAKKWIIIGDTRQLSPFVDKDELEENIKNLPLQSNKPLEKSYQRACFILYKMAEIYKANGFKLKMAMGVSSEELEIIESEIQIRKSEGRDNFGVLNNRLEVGYITKDSKPSYFENLEKHWIFYDTALAYSTGLQNPLSSHIPQDFIDLSNPALLYQYQADGRVKDMPLHFKKSYSSKHKDFIESFVNDVNKDMQERNFASEIAWRLNREFEKRTFEDSKDSKKNKKGNTYTKVIDELLPKSHGQRVLIRNKIATIGTIALPSILESLIKGVNDSRSETRRDSAIRSGFGKEELASRHSILSVQGRMHPDISRFPRERFYKEANALQDLPDLEREWDYTHYKTRNVWIDVKGKGYRGRNEEEAKILMRELTSFVDYAQKNKHPLGEEWSVAVLSFYKGQTRILESKLQEFTGLRHKTTDFSHKFGDTQIHIKLCTVDRFQGQEADIVFLSMVNTDKIGFLDSPNRLNVGITRAKFQLVVLGDRDYFLNKYKNENRPCNDLMLQEFADKTPLHKEG